MKSAVSLIAVLGMTLHMSGLRRFALAWVGLFLLWFLFVFQLTWAEAMVGALCTAVAVTAAYVIALVAPICFSPPLHASAQLWRLPAMIVSDLRLLGKHLFLGITHQHSPSGFQSVPFRSNGDDCQSAGRRALTVLFVSTTPNSIVLDIDRGKGEMLTHLLMPAPTPKIVGKLQE